MRKRIIERNTEQVAEADGRWLDLESLVQAELTSEDALFPIESALIAGAGPGWRAAGAGEQTLRLLFDHPQRISLIRLLFDEPDQQRTQEFTLRWSQDGGVTKHEIARQQYNFSAPDATSESEAFHVDLHDVNVLELHIIPDISGGHACASLSRWSVA